MKKNIYLLLLTLAVLAIPSCNRDHTITTGLPPKILLDESGGILTVKVGRTITIAPEYEHADQAQYRWMSGGRLLGTGPSLDFTGKEAGEVYIQLTIETAFGRDSEEFRVDVAELEIPSVFLPGAEEGLEARSGEILHLEPVVRECSIPTVFRWTLNGEEVSEEKRYDFQQKETGRYDLTFAAENEDGKDSIAFTVTVVAGDSGFYWKFTQTEYNVQAGREIRIAPDEIRNAESASYRWKVDGEILEGADTPFLIFSSDRPGDHIVQAEAVFTENGTEQVSGSGPLTVHVFPAGDHYRPKDKNSAADFSRIFEFTPAPGQFVNETKIAGYDGSEKTPEAAAAYAGNRMRKQLFVSLGGFGGYIIAGFDHSIDNTGDYDFAVVGNSFDHSSEPGIVWVMQDENGDGLPNDTWYELKGSETGHPGTIRDYSVTYYRPSAEGMSVPWKDNLGNSGTIDYMGSFHDQPGYYPLWITTDSYTLKGTRLESKKYLDGGDWIFPPFGWGYADNFSSEDTLLDSVPLFGDPMPNHFRISDAIRFDGQPAELRYIDFIKIQCAVNDKGGRIGECSTEVLGIYDYSMKKK